MPIKVLWAGGMLCLLLLGGRFFDSSGEVLDEIFCPAETLSGYESYARGDSLRDILIHHCRQKLIQTGVYG